MGAHSSIKITRIKAEQIVFKAMRNDEDLLDMVNMLVERKTLWNIRGFVDPNEPNDDHLLDFAEL